MNLWIRLLLPFLHKIFYIFFQLIKLQIKLYIYSVADSKEKAEQKVLDIEKIAKEKMMNVK